MDHFKRSMMPIVAMAAIAAGMAHAYSPASTIASLASSISMGPNAQRGGPGTKAFQRAAAKRRNRIKAAATDSTSPRPACRSVAGIVPTNQESIMFHTPAHKATGDFSPSQFGVADGQRTYEVEVRTDDGIKTVQVVAESRVKAGLAAARMGHEVLTVMAARG